MLGSGILDMVLGLIFFYFLLSTICSTVQEWIATVLSLRARTLKHAIGNMLGSKEAAPTAGAEAQEKAGGQPSPAEGLAVQLYDHPIIQAQSKDGKPPSYISPQSFSTALIDTLTHSVRAPADGSAPPAPRDAAETYQHLREASAALPHESLRRTLLALVDGAHGDLNKARANIERWFDDTMDRVSGWYKRIAQRNILVLALLLTAVINGDTLHLAHHLWRDGMLRDTVAATAKDASAKGNLNATQVQQQITQLHTPIGWHSADLPGEGPRSHKVWWFLGKLFGLVLTALAVSLGAPFWFQILNKIGSLRATGDRPERSEQVTTVAAAAVTTTTAALAAPAAATPAAPAAAPPAAPMPPIPPPPAIPVIQ